jgi:hypothetical protein
MKNGKIVKMRNGWFCRSASLLLLIILNSCDQNPFNCTETADLQKLKAQYGQPDSSKIRIYKDASLFEYQYVLVKNLKGREDTIEIKEYKWLQDNFTYVVWFRENDPYKQSPVNCKTWEGSKINF